MPQPSIMSSAPSSATMVSLVPRVDWNDPKQIAMDVKVYQAYLFCLLGVFTWDFILSSWYDFKIVTGRIKFRWPMIFYFGSRLATFGALVPVIITNNVTDTFLNCKALIVTVLFFAGASVYMSAAIFVLRTIAVWGRRLWVIVLLGVLWLSLVTAWSYNCTSIINVWEGIGQGCIPVHVFPYFSAPYVVTEVIDVTTLSLTAYQLFKVQSNAANPSSISMVLFQQGLSYFIVNVVFNTVSLVLIWSNVNTVMHFINSIAALTFASIMSCTAFRDLSTGTVREGHGWFASSEKGRFWNGWTEGQSAIGPVSHDGTGRQPSRPQTGGRSSPTGEGVRITLSKVVRRDGYGYERHDDVDLASLSNAGGAKAGSEGSQIPLDGFHSEEPISSPQPAHSHFARAADIEASTYANNYQVGEAIFGNGTSPEIGAHEIRYPNRHPFAG